MIGLPSLKGLAAFEAVERLGSVSAAALELSVTQPAVSQQIKTLEQHLGVRLFQREAHGLVLSPDAALFALRVRQALKMLDEASKVMREKAVATPKSVTVAVLSTLAQRWLIPRLVTFQEAHPGIEVRLITVRDQSDFAHMAADLSIQCGRSKKRNQRSDFLLQNQILPIASPELMARLPISEPSDLSSHNLIRIDKAPRDADWPAWLEAVGLATLAPRNWMTFDNSNQALEAAVAGLGVAISHTPFVIDALNSGRLTMPFDIPLADIDGDYFVHSSASAHPNVDRFRRWLISETHLV